MLFRNQNDLEDCVSRLHSVVLLFVLHIPTLVTAQSEMSTDMAEFGKTYLAFEAAREAGNLEDALRLSGEALNLGRDVYGAYNENTAMLAQNYAVHLQYFGRISEAQQVYKEMLEIYDEIYGADSLNHVMPMVGIGSTMPAGDQEQLDIFRRALSIQSELAPEDSSTFAEHAVVIGDHLSENEDHRNEAIEILERAVELLERDFGDNSPRLVAVLLALGRAQSIVGYFATRDTADTYRKARAITRRNFPRDELRYADVSFQAGRDLFEATQSRLGIPYLEDAYEIYGEQFGSADPRTAAAALLLGRNYLILKQTRFAEQHFLEAIDFFNGRAEYVGNEVQARTLYVHAVGSRDPDIDVTDQLIALARLTTWSDNQEYSPLLKVSPRYPLRAARSGWEGYVIVEFTVDETGRTRDAYVIESTSSVFEDSALEAVSQFRYIPRIVDGERVPVQDVRNKLTFELPDLL